MEVFQNSYKLGHKENPNISQAAIQQYFTNTEYFEKNTEQSTREYKK